MGVIMQAFYWDCPKLAGLEYKWWSHVRDQVEQLAQVGFTALWLPPVNKAGNVSGISMGYDPYDYYDLGEFDQKGTKPTWFGSKAKLTSLIRAAHDRGLHVYADLVINHNSGGDAEEKNPIDGRTRWTKFTPKSGKFERNWEHFHPNQYELYDDGRFGDMPDLCHHHPYVYDEILKLARWMVEDIGFDGFRYDMVKGYGGWMVRAIQELRLRGGSFRPFGVGECWDSDYTIDQWLDEANAFSDNPASAFDFPQRYRLRDLCQQYGFDLRALAYGGTLSRDRPFQAVTFVENHDVERDDPIVQNKMLAYAYILTHEGYPCVFWRDYFEYGLARPDQPDGIDALVDAHRHYAGGNTDVLYADHDLYIMQRRGWGGQPGLVFILNNRGDWAGHWVGTCFANQSLVPVAYSCAETPYAKWTQSNGWVDIWAPPRGYVVYAVR